MYLIEVQGNEKHLLLNQIFDTGESKGIKHISDMSVEALHQTIGSGGAGPIQAVFNVEGLTELIKFMDARGLALEAGKQHVG